MKRQGLHLTNLLLIVALALGGCTRSRAAESAPPPMAENAPPIAMTATPVPGATATVAPATATVEPPLAKVEALPAAQMAESVSLPPLSRTVNVLLLGSDRRPNEPNWRTDVLMILALDVEGKQAAAISLPRDIYIDQIPGHKPNKINVVDYLSEKDDPGNGPGLLISILQEKLGIPIHHFLRFEFESFKQVVDALDGVELNIEC